MLLTLAEGAHAQAEPPLPPAPSSTLQWRTDDASSIAEPRPVPETLQYVNPMPVNGLRAVLQLEGIFLTGFLYYVTTSGLDHNWELNYSWDVFSKKITGEAFGPDHNHFGTNFVGHPLGGLGYYQAARSNRFGIYESGAMAFAGSLLWEYFGEIREVVSFNDTLVTPMAGWAIGESLFQLGAFFDRSGPQLHNRILGGLFGPLKSLNDWSDDASLRRSRTVFPQNEWHHFDLESSFFVAHEQGPRDVAPGAPASSGDALEGRVSFQERLVRMPDYDGAGQRSVGFTEANASSMSLSAAFAHSGLTDLDFRAQTILAGHYFRNAWSNGRQVYGHGGLVGLGIGFDYAVHDWRRNEPGQIDRVSSVTPLDLVVLQRVDAGALHLDTTLDIGPNFGGVRALALDRALVDTRHLPSVTRLHGYYLAFGGHARAALRATWRALELGAGAYVEGYRQARESKDEIGLADTRGKFEASLGARIGNSPWRIRTRVEHALRGSTADERHVFERETSVGLATAAVF